jgi:hypothetical protein
MYMYLQKVISKKKLLTKISFVGVLGRSMTKIAGSESGSNLDPDPLVREMDPRIQIRIRIHPQNVMDPHHCSVSG